jgi:DNA-directed RNA polymerase specialized sigma24 family protein
MSGFEAIIEDLRSLPPDKLEEAADFIRRLKPISPEQREAILARTFGSLSQEDANAMLEAIEEACERIDEPRS